MKLKRSSGIKVGTLAKQRNQGFGLPYVIIGRKPKKKKSAELFFTTREAIEEVLKTKGVVA